MLAVDAALLAPEADDAKELRLVIQDEEGNDRARVAAPLPPPGKLALGETAYARILADGRLWRIAWRGADGAVNQSVVYAPNATRAVESLPTPEPRP
jgi:hypothetical protein